MNIIRKHPVEAGGINRLRFAKGAEVLCFAPDPTGTPCVWESSDTEATETEPRTFLLVGASHPYDATGAEYVGTGFVGLLVLHLFEVEQ